MLNSLLEWIQSTQLFQIFVARSLLRHPKLLFVYIGMFMAFLHSLDTGIEFLNPVLNLDQMLKSRFVIVGAYWPPRSSCGAYISVKSLNDGRVETYYDRTSKEEFEILKNHSGEEITFWTQTLHGLYKWNCPTVQQMEFQGKIPFDYSDLKKSYLARKKRRPIEFGVSMSLWVMPLLYVYLRFRQG